MYCGKYIYRILPQKFAPRNRCIPFSFDAIVLCFFPWNQQSWAAIYQHEMSQNLKPWSCIYLYQFLANYIRTFGWEMFAQIKKFRSDLNAVDRSQYRIFQKLVPIQLNIPHNKLQRWEFKKKEDIFTWNDLISIFSEFLSFVTVYLFVSKNTKTILLLRRVFGCAPLGLFQLIWCWQRNRMDI